MISGALTELGGVSRLVVSALAPCAFLVAAFLPIPAAYEQWHVSRVAEWREVPARLDAVEMKRPTFGKGPSTWRYTFTRSRNRQALRDRRYRTGRFPLYGPWLVYHR